MKNSETAITAIDMYVIDCSAFIVVVGFRFPLVYLLLELEECLFL
jgi:hypothetical protein